MVSLGPMENLSQKKNNELLLQPPGNLEWQTKNALKVIFASNDLFTV